MKKIEKIRPYNMYSMMLMTSCNELLEKANRALMYTHRLRHILSLIVEKYIDGKYPMYINDLFAVNAGGNGRKLKMQPKCSVNIICRHVA